VPEDCQLLIIAGPRLTGLLPNETARIDNYLAKRGGRLLLLLNNQFTNSGVEPILAKWGVRTLNDRVLEKDKTCLLLQDSSQPDGSDFVNSGFCHHPVMDAIQAEGSQLRFSAPRPFLVGQTAQTPGAPVISILATTSTNAVLEHQPETPSRFALAVAIEQGVIKGVNAPGGGTRILAVGDSSMFANGRLDTGANHMFASLALTWLLERPEYLLDGLAPRPIKEYKLILTQSQLRMVALLFELGLPGTILLVGGLVWLRRRS